MLGEAFVDDAHFSDADPDTVDLLQRLLGATQVISVQVDALPTDDLSPRDEKKAAAVKAIAALRAHGNAGIERNLQAAAAVATLKAALPRGEFGPFCTETLQISSTYRARLLRLAEVGDHVREALAWAATQKHRLAECQSAQHLIKVVDDWLNKDKPAEPKADSKTRERGRSKDIIAKQERVIQEAAALVKERDNTIFEHEFEIASRDDVIADLERRSAECEDDIAALRDPLTDEARELALEAMTSSRESAAGELAAIAKRYHWRLKDLRHELSFTAVWRQGRDDQPSKTIEEAEHEADLLAKALRRDGSE